MKRPSTLREMLHVVILGLSLAAATSFIATGLLSQQIFSAFKTYSQQSIPLLDAIHAIQSESQLFSESLTKLTLQRSHEDVELTTTSLQTSLNDITLQLETINTLQPQSSQREVFDNLASVQSLVQKQYEGMKLFLQLESDSHTAHEHLLQLVQKLKTNIDLAILDLEFEAIVATSVNTEKMQQDHDNLIAIKLEIDNLPIFTVQAALANTASSVTDQKNNAGILMRHVITMLATLHDLQLKSDLSKALAVIYHEHNAHNGFYSLKLNQLRISQETAENNSLIRVILGTFSQNVETIIDRLKHRANNNLSALEHLVQAAIIFAVVLLFLLLIGYIIVYKWIITRLVLKPFDAATKAIHGLSQGKLDYPPFETRMYELKQMENALHIFKDNADTLRERERSLTKTNLALDKSNEKLRTFVRVSSHDLKSPLRGIRILSEQLIENINEKEWETARKNVQRIDTRALRLDNLLNALLDFIRIDRKSWKTELIDVHKTISEQLELLPKQKEMNLTVRSDIPEITLHSVPFTTVVRNLVDNALKHHDKEKGLISVQISRQDNVLLLSVTDDGPGIEPKYQDRIFEPFQTLRPKDEVEGAGMGLSIINKLITEVGGTIHVKSPVMNSRGSRFIVEWPLPQ